MTHAEEDTRLCGLWLLYSLGPSLRKGYKITNKKLVKKVLEGTYMQVKGPELKLH